MQINLSKTIAIKRQAWNSAKEVVAPAKTNALDLK